MSNCGILSQYWRVCRENLRYLPMPAALELTIAALPGAIAMPIAPARLETLSALARKVLWLSSWTIHHANHIRPNVDGLKVGGHQASSASLANIMSALYFSVVGPPFHDDVKPHASPVFHAIQYLF